MFKLYALIITTILFFAGSVMATDAAFTWLPNPPGTDGYKIHYGPSTRNYTHFTDVGFPEIKEELGEDGMPEDRVEATVTGFTPGETYFFAATAYNIEGESGYSDEVEITFPTIDTGDPVIINMTINEP